MQSVQCSVTTVKSTVQISYSLYLHSYGSYGRGAFAHVWNVKSRWSPEFSGQPAQALQELFKEMFQYGFFFMCVICIHLNVFVPTRALM